MTAKETRPSGHVQIVERRAGRRWHALWRDADGRHQRVLGPAWVKDSGRRTPRGAIVWRAANGRKPNPSYLSPAEADDLLRQILAGAPRQATRARPGTGTRFMDVAEDWMLHGERKRGLKRGTLRDYRYTVDGHLLPAFGAQEIAGITPEGIERPHPPTRPRHRQRRTPRRRPHHRRAGLPGLRCLLNARRLAHIRGNRGGSPRRARRQRRPPRPGTRRRDQHQAELDHSAQSVWLSGSGRRLRLLRFVRGDQCAPDRPALPLLPRRGSATDRDDRAGRALAARQSERPARRAAV